MSVLPSIRGAGIPPRIMRPPPPSLRDIAPAAAAPAAASGPMRPLPAVRTSYFSSPTPDRITLVEDTSPKPTKKRGRPSKADKLKAMRARASDAVRCLVESEPKKKDVLEFLRGRLEELEDGI